VDRTAGTVSITLSGGMESIETAAAALRQADVTVADFSLRRPTLDDVFISLTGKSA
jgi:ABC-2 type transport system ATP-binding protein